MNIDDIIKLKLGYIENKMDYLYRKQNEGERKRM